MKEKNTIETIGSISKIEILATIEETFCGNTLVLESKYPFPGYYDTTIPDTKVLHPGTVFIITKKRHNEERIMRINHDVKKEFRKRFDASPGQVTVFNELKPCISVRFLESYNSISELVDLYNKLGIRFLKYRKINPYDGIIKIRKYFVLKDLGPGIYMDVQQPEMCYIQIPALLRWNTFEKITLDMKRNIEDNKFDAAIGTILRKNCIVDVIRIYDEHINEDKINFLKLKYLEAIKKLNK